MFNLGKNVKAVFFILAYLSFIRILLLKSFIVGIYLVINGIPLRLCFISVMWKVCLNGLLMSLFCSIVRVGTRKRWIFHNSLRLILSRLLLLVVLKGVNF